MSQSDMTQFKAQCSGATQTHILNPDSLDWKGCRFLDPNGKVFETSDGKVYRAIYPHRQAYIESLFNRGIIDELVSKELLVPTSISSVQVEGFSMVLEHKRVPFLIWPADWTRETLKDSALALLDVNIALLPHGLGTIDGHGANILQINSAKPVLIDLGSINPLGEIDGGNGMFDEFFKCFLRPLLLMANRPGLTRTTELMIKDGGVDATEFLEITGVELQPSGTSREALLHELREAVANVQFPSLGTYWDGYHAEDQYRPPQNESENPRSWAIYKILETLKPKRLIDLGANAGIYTIWGSRFGAESLAIDYDRGALSNLHQALRTLNEPISISIARRDACATQAVDNVLTADLTFALALIHHLSITQLMPFKEIAKVFASYSTEHLVTEFMANGLGGTKPVPDPLPEWYTLENFMASFEPYFDKIEAIHTPIPEGSSHRILVHCSGKRS